MFQEYLEFEVKIKLIWIKYFNGLQDDQKFARLKGVITFQ